MHAHDLERRQWHLPIAHNNCSAIRPTCMGPTNYCKLKLAKTVVSVDHKILSSHNISSVCIATTPCAGGLEWRNVIPVRYKLNSYIWYCRKISLFPVWGGLEWRNVIPVRYKLNSYIWYSRKISLFPVWGGLEWRNVIPVRYKLNSDRKSVV
jgi:hypothetical protein